MVQKAVNITVWNMRLLDILAVTGILYLAWAWTDRVTVEAGQYFVVNLVYVEDSVVGSDPELLYDNEIKEDFRATWQADIKTAKDGEIICSAHNHHTYEKDDPLKLETLSEYMEKPCHLPAGQYVITTVWSLYNIKRVINNTSNVFTVYSVKEWGDGVAHRHGVSDDAGI